MIAIAGGTGRLGTLMVGRLLEQGQQVRVLTRDLARAGHLPAAVEVVVGDVRQPATLAAALAGAQVVVSAVHGFTGPRGISPASVDRDGNAHLIAATRAAGADLVLLSVVAAAAESPMELFRMKDAAERCAAASGVPTTVVRASAFVELWVELLNKTAAKSGRPLVFGRGENAVNFVSVGDVAALVQRVIEDRSSRGATLEIGGPDTMTFCQLAAAVQASAGRESKPRHVPTAALRVMAATVERLQPQLGRQARAALAMEHMDLTCDTAPLRARYPDLPFTSVREVLGRGAVPGAPAPLGPSASGRLEPQGA